MNNRVLSFEQVKNEEIEIFENRFELNFNEDYINKLKNLKIEKINEEDIFEELKKMLNVILNDENAYDKIKNSYEAHEKKEMSTQVFIKVLTFIIEEYTKEVQKIQGYKFNNREIRRNYKRNNRYNRR
jgi:DNA gyrase/topoisomerase IV subunit B